MQRIRTKLFLAAGLLALAAPAHAGIIPNGNYPGSGSGGTALSTVTNSSFINVDQVGKIFTSATAPAVIDTVYTDTPNSTVNAYLVPETVTNSTGQRLTSLTLELGTGTGTSFVLAPAGSQLQFLANNPPPTSSNLGNGVGGGTQTLTYSGGTGVAPGHTGNFLYGLDVPDVAGGHFTLREIATFTPLPVPEPSSVVLAGLGGLGLLGLALRRRSR